MHRPPFRADHIGSLLRPPALRQAYRAFNDRALDEAGFVAAQDSAIRDAIALQAEAGLSVVTDGEFRRASYWSRFVERTEGLSLSESRFTFRDEQGQELSFTAPLVTGKVARRRPIAVDEFCFLRDNATALPKVTLPAPSTMHFWRGTGYAAPGVYDTPEKFFRDLAAVYRAEIARAGRGRLPLYSARRSRAGHAVRPGRAPTGDCRRQRSGATDQPLCRGARRRGRVGTAGDGGRRAFVPRQFQGQISGRGRLRRDRQGLVRRHRRDPLPARIRHARAAISRRCVSSRRTRASCSASSARKAPRSKQPKICSAALQTQRATSTKAGSPSARDAASPLPSPAIR